MILEAWQMLIMLPARYHSSFWPPEGVDVRGKRCAVIGTGASGVQISQVCHVAASMGGYVMLTIDRNGDQLRRS